MPAAKRVGPTNAPGSALKYLIPPETTKPRVTGALLRSAAIAAPEFKPT